MTVAFLPSAHNCSSDCQICNVFLFHEKHFYDMLLFIDGAKVQQKVFIAAI